MPDGTQAAEGKRTRYQVIDGPLSIRKNPNGDRTGKLLGHGQQFIAASDPVNAGNHTWIQHATGWSAIGTSDGTAMYMLDITHRDPNAPRRFKVWTASLSIRDAAGGRRIPQKLFRRAEIDVDPNSRTFAAGYIWWKHNAGWSAERSINGNQVFMKEVFDSPESIPLPEKKKARLPDTWTGIMALQAAQSVNVRGRPNINPLGLIIKRIARGEVLHCDMDTLTEADNYYWVRHDLGWSAIQSVDGKSIFLVEPGTIPGLIAIGPNGPKGKDLPHYRAMFTRLPVALEDIQWFQYFGNNMFAMRNGRRFGYDRYSQGLHGGLDFGNSKGPKPIVAGVEAEFVKMEFPSRNNMRMILKRDDYTIIYQHITASRQYQPGDQLTPDSPIGLIEHMSINNGWNHLHLEVRFMKKWIVNPLLLFSPEIYKALVGRFDPNKANTGYLRDFPESSSNFFYKTPDWTTWTTPLDQPMIKLAGEVIGPRAEKSV